jgi:hypothetical protein
MRLQLAHWPAALSVGIVKAGCQIQEVCKRLCEASQAASAETRSRAFPPIRQQSDMTPKATPHGEPACFAERTMVPVPRLLVFLCGTARSWQPRLMSHDELLSLLAGLRQARVGRVRVPHKPLLLLWLFGQFAATGSSAASYQQAEAPVSQLINDFGPPVASTAAARQRAAMPFVHLERELWDLRDAAGNEIAPDAPERRGWLLDHGAVGRLRPPWRCAPCTMLCSTWASWASPRTAGSACPACTWPGTRPA